MSKTAIRVPEEIFKEIIEPYAKATEMSIEDAVVRLLKYGWSRVKALSSYAGDGKIPLTKKAPKAEKVAKPKKPKVAKPKKPKVAKKAKKKAGGGPLVEAAAEAKNAPAAAAELETDDDFGPPPVGPAEPLAPVTSENALQVLFEPEPEELTPEKLTELSQPESIDKAAAAALGELDDPFADFDEDPDLH